MEIVIAALPGTVVIDGQRQMVRRGVTTAHVGHEIVERYPHLWKPIDVDYPVSEEPQPVDEPLDERPESDQEPVDEPLDAEPGREGGAKSKSAKRRKG